MAHPSINGAAFPASLTNRGKWDFQRPAVRFNAQGDAFRSGEQVGTFAFPYMTQTELNWFLALFSAGAQSASVTCELWDDYMREVDFTGAKLQLPVVKSGFYGGLYHDVEIMFKRMLPLV
jgi:hypothetical protein